MLVIIPLGAPALYAFLLFKCHGNTLTAIKDIDVQRTLLEKGAKAEDQYNRWDDKMTEKGALLSNKKTEVADQLAALEKKETALVATLPGYIQSLAGNGYSKSLFFFEIVECFRKLSIGCDSS